MLIIVQCSKNSATIRFVHENKGPLFCQFSTIAQLSLVVFCVIRVFIQSSLMAGVTKMETTFVKSKAKASCCMHLQPFTHGSN